MTYSHKLHGIHVYSNTPTKTAFEVCEQVKTVRDNYVHVLHTLLEPFLLRSSLAQIGASFFPSLAEFIDDMILAGSK